MIKRLPKPVESEESKFKNQFYIWLNDSHYWIEHSEVAFQCKWCRQIQPMILSESTLCMKNPEIIKIVERLEPFNI